MHTHTHTYKYTHDYDPHGRPTTGTVAETENMPIFEVEYSDPGYVMYCYVSMLRYSI